MSINFETSLSHAENQNNGKIQSNIDVVNTSEAKAVNKEKLKQVEKLVNDSGEKSKKIPLSPQQRNDTLTQLDKSPLSSQEKQKVKDSIKEGKFDFLHEEGMEGGILATFLNILSVIFSHSSQKNEDADTSEILSQTDKIPEMTKMEFAKAAKKQAKKIDAKYGIPWEISLAQTILESGWGQASKAREHGVYFGVKGKGKVLMSTEDYGNGIVKEASEFRTYDNLEQAFEGYAQFILENPRYSEAFKYSTDIYNNGNKPTGYVGRDPIRFIQEIKKAGYATDSEYIGKIAGVMKSVEKRNV